MVVGGYELLHEIGSGGMATVYLARQLDLGRLSALKELGGLNRPDPTYARRFVREAQMAGSLSHPNIVTVYDYLTHEGTPYIAMEYLARGSLRPYVGKLSLAQLGGVLEGLLAGLAHAHAAGIVHRDLKPENVLVADDGRVKIADFGIATATGELRYATRITATGSTIGTPEYMAPEQAMGKEVGPATDLYSVGMIALELATGRLPFDDAESQIAVMMRQVRQPTPPARKLDPRVDRGVSDWIERLLVKDPRRRTPSALRAWEELEEVLIDRLGARWRRTAALGEPASSGGEPSAGATPSTAPLGVDGLAPTVLPSRPARAVKATARGRRRPGRRQRLLRTAVALAMAAGLVFAAVGGNDASPPSAPASATAPSPSRAAQPSAPRSASPTPSASAPQTPSSAPAVTAAPPRESRPTDDSGVGDSRSDDPSDDEPDEDEA